MSTPEPQKSQDPEYVADINRRFGDLLAPENRKGRWGTVRDRLAIAAVILVLAMLVFLIADGMVVNFRCTFAEFVMFECNRWTGEEHPSLRRYNREPAGASGN